MKKKVKSHYKHSRFYNYSLVDCKLIHLPFWPTCKSRRFFLPQEMERLIKSSSELDYLAYVPWKFVEESSECNCQKKRIATIPYQAFYRIFRLLFQVIIDLVCVVEKKILHLNLYQYTGINFFVAVTSQSVLHITVKSHYKTDKRRLLFTLYSRAVLHGSHGANVITRSHLSLRGFRARRRSPCCRFGIWEKIFQFVKSQTHKV